MPKGTPKTICHFLDALEKAENTGSKALNKVHGQIARAWKTNAFKRTAIRCIGGLGSDNQRRAVVAMASVFDRTSDEVALNVVRCSFSNMLEEPKTLLWTLNELDGHQNTKIREAVSDYAISGAENAEEMSLFAENGMFVAIARRNAVNAAQRGEARMALSALNR